MTVEQRPHLKYKIECTLKMYLFSELVEFALKTSNLWPGMDNISDKILYNLPDSVKEVLENNSNT